MARIRSLKPEMWQSETFGTVSIEAQAMFIGLITQADDHGRLQGSAARMRALIWPYKTDLDTAWVDGLLDELQSAELVLRYEHDEKQYLALPGWADHQKVDRPSESRFPAPHGPDSRAFTNPRESSRALAPDQGSRIKDQGSGSKRASPSVEPGLDAVARELFAYWQEQCGHPNAKPTKDRLRKVVARLREGYTAEQIRCGIDGAARAAYVGDNGKVYDDLELICRNGSKLESFIDRGKSASDDGFVKRMNARAAA